MLTLTGFQRTLTAVVLFVFAVSLVRGQTIHEDFKVIANDPIETEADLFGTSVGVWGGIAIVGAPWDQHEVGIFAGSAYLIDTNTGQQLFKLTASDASVVDKFGGAVAISGTTAIVGAADFSPPGMSFNGAAYLFNATTGEELFKLVALDSGSNDMFGGAVGISGSTAIIGARADNTDAGNDSGSAYLFDTTTGEQLFKLTASDAAGDDFFGASVAISGTTALVGAWGNDDAGDTTGSAYLFDTTTGEQLFRLVASDSPASSSFGSPVAISGTTAIVGSGGSDGIGSVFVFDTTTGEQLFELIASDGAEGDLFAFSISISGTTAVVGARWDDDDGSASGSAYLFDTTTGQQILKFTGSDADSFDHFGSSVSISGRTILVGTPEDEENGNRSGSVYVFTMDAPCTADLTDDENLDFFDVSAFLVAFGNLDPVADFESDGSFDFFDISAFLVAFVAGCP